ncbi:MAG TPA: NB-ARC domain-containing protein [Streptosporangiaceae bacterium]|nr:NB-ARC domain-containing protein [Streptosporangiaceae bacterium]
MTAPPTPASASPDDGRPGAGAGMRGTASDEGRVYQAGHDQTIVQRQTVLPPGRLRPVTDVTVAPGFTGLPVRPDLFVGRAKELAQLRAALAAPASSAVEDAASTPGSGRPRSRAAGPGAGRGRSPQGAVPATGSSAVATGVVVQAVHGLGGIGKSTLAAHYAATCADDYELLWWITADSAAAVASGLAGLAIALEPELTDVLPLEALTERAVQWLAAHDRWLLILDNVSDPRDVAPSLARTRAGRFLITSRLAAGWHQITSLVVRLDILAEGEAVELLSSIATQGRPGADLDGARELCAELGFLPLAIEAGSRVPAPGQPGTPRLRQAAGRAPGGPLRPGGGRRGRRAHDSQNLANHPGPADRYTERR